jgi:hypothetical protein
MNIEVYNDDKDKKISALVSFLILGLMFLFLIITTIPQADPPIYETVYPEVEMDMLIPMEAMELAETSGGGGGGGTPTNDRVDPIPREQSAKVLTSNSSTTDLKVASGNSNKTNSNNKTNTATSTEASTNYFGDGGSGSGKEGGKGSGFGTDNGPGDGPGSGSGSGGGGGGRVRYGNPNNDNIYSDEPQTIYLKLTVNAEGEVVGGKSTSKTTTTDQRIINQVLTNVKSQVRYSKKAGASLEFVYLTVNVRAN